MCPERALVAGDAAEASSDLRVLVARRCDALKRTPLHLAVHEHACDADALSDVIRQLQSIRVVDDLDRGRAPLQKPRLPRPRLRRIRAACVLQPERLVIALE